MAPEDWFNTDKGAVNGEIGCYWWRPEEKASWPGNKMTSAPEIGRNVFKITDVPDGAFEIIFNDYTENTDGREAFQVRLSYRKFTIGHVQGTNSSEQGW